MKSLDDWFRIIVLITGSIVALVLAFASMSYLDLLFLDPTWLLVSLYISNCMHQLGHVVAGWLVGFPTKKIIIGMWKNIWRGHIHGTSTDLVINLGFTGFTIIGDVLKQDWIRIRYFVYFFGGIGIQCLFVLLGLQIKQTYMFFDLFVVPPVVLNSFISANIGLIFGELLPLQSQTNLGGGIMQTDGMRLLKVFFMGEKEITEFLITGQQVDGMDNLQAKNFPAAEQNFRECLDRAPKSIFSHINLSVALCKQQRIDEAIAVLLEGLTHSPKKGELTLIYNNLAWYYLLKATSDRQYLERADDYSSQAIAINKSNLVILGTRGCVLVETGRLESGIETLKKITKLNQPISEPTNSVISFLYLAYGYYRQMDWSNSLKYWRKIQENEDLTNFGEYPMIYEYILNQTNGFQKLYEMG